MENTSLDEKVKNLEVDLGQARTQIERMSSAKLDEVLSAQKPNSDKTGLGYAVCSDPSSSTTSRSKIVFVPQSKKGDKDMKSKTDLTNSKSFVRPHSRKSSFSKTTHVCHHCGVSGHIPPNCFKLYPHKQVSNRLQVPSQGSTPLFRELLKVLSFFTQFQENSNSSMSFSRHTRIHAFSSSDQATRSSTAGHLRGCCRGLSQCQRCRTSLSRSIASFRWILRSPPRDMYSRARTRLLMSHLNPSMRRHRRSALRP